MHYELLSLKFNTSFKRLFLQPLLTSPVPLLLTEQRCSSLPSPEERAASPNQLFLVVIKHFLLALLVLSWHTRETWNIFKNTPKMTFHVFFSSRHIANIAVPFGIKIFSPDILWEGKKKKEIWRKKKQKLAVIQILCKVTGNLPKGSSKSRICSPHIYIKFVVFCISKWWSLFSSAVAFNCAINRALSVQKKRVFDKED